MLRFKDLIFDLPQAQYIHEGKVLNSMKNMHQAFPLPNHLLVFTCQITSHFFTSKASSTGVMEQSLQTPKDSIQSSQLGGAGFIPCGGFLAHLTRACLSAKAVLM